MKKYYKRSTKPIFFSSKHCLSREQIDKYDVELFARLENKLTTWRQIEG